MTPGRESSEANSGEPRLNCPLPLPHHDQIVLGHGSGGKLTGELIECLFYPPLQNPLLLQGDDAAVISFRDQFEEGERMAVSTDAHIVQPLFFPGGDIGRLSICGTVNDLAMVGAIPLWITASFILEEGLDREVLENVVISMRESAEEAGVTVVAGDTKVVERGQADGLYISTTGVGRIPEGGDCSGRNARPGDAVILSGTIGDHGIAVLAARGELAFETEIVSDTAPLNGLVEAMFETGAGIHTLRDPTRGGVAATLNEIAGQSGVAIYLEEKNLLVSGEVQGACELLGFDPLHIANEGKLIAMVSGESAADVVEAMRSNRYGREALIIGRVESDPENRVLLETGIGGTRIIDMPAGELLPRIC
jgi:hydrogenase expression/formation protein HypE